MNKSTDDLYKIYKTLVDVSKKLPYKGSRTIIKKLFRPILESDGYKINSDSMRRHGYLEYIASKGKGDFRQTIGVSFNSDEGIMSKNQIEELVAGCTIDGIDSLIFISNSGIEFNAEEFDKNLYPVKFQYFSFDRLGEWVQKYENRGSESAVIRILRECTQQIIKAIFNNPEVIDDLEWRDLERTIAELFRGLGFIVELTPSAKDGGKDVILELKKNNEKLSYIVEIKHWRSKQQVGKSPINEFVKVIAQEKRTGGLFLSTYGISNGAVESITKLERRNVRFGDKNKIFSLCETYIKNVSGLWLKDLELEEELMKNTL